MEPTKPTITAAEMHTAEQVLQLYRERYFDYNVRYFHEKFVEQRGIRSYSRVKAALQGAELIQKRGRRGTHRRRGPACRACCCKSMPASTPGFRTDVTTTRSRFRTMPTSKIYYARRVEEEGARTPMPAVREVIERQGIFRSLYSD